MWNKCILRINSSSFSSNTYVLLRNYITWVKYHLPLSFVLGLLFFFWFLKVANVPHWGNNSNILIPVWDQIEILFAWRVSRIIPSTELSHLIIYRHLLQKPTFEFLKSHLWQQQRHHKSNLKNIAPVFSRKVPRVIQLEIKLHFKCNYKRS